jgi:transcriptional regulator with XRE-family HTH domain
VALLAGVSIAYYTQLERGDTSGVSETVLESLTRALQLDEAERTHLFDLARAQSTTARPRRRRTPQRLRPEVQRLLDAITAPAMVRNGRMDILGTNQLGRALYAQMFANPRKPVSSARFTFLDPRATDFFVDWDHAADDSVAVLRGEAGCNPNDRDLSDLVGELSTQSEEFRTRWARHDVLSLVLKGASSITPALLTRMSALPSSSWTRAAAPTSESRSVTSAWIAIAPLPSSSATA